MVQEPQKKRLVRPEELRAVMDSHAQWLASGGKEGQQADLSGALLTGHPTLDNMDFNGANCRGTDFGKAVLVETTHMQGAEFDRQTTMKRVSGAPGIIATAAGTKLSADRLPDQVKTYQRLLAGDSEAGKAWGRALADREYPDEQRQSRSR